MIKKIMNDKGEEMVMLDEVLNTVSMNNIEDMKLISNENDPCISIFVKDEVGNRINYLMRATKGCEIHGINELLKSFNLDKIIKFSNFTQYECLIGNCMKLIKSMRKVTA